MHYSQDYLNLRVNASGILKYGKRNITSQLYTFQLFIAHQFLNALCRTQLCLFPVFSSDSKDLSLQSRPLFVDVLCFCPKLPPLFFMENSNKISLFSFGHPAPVEVYRFPHWWQVAGLSLWGCQESEPHRFSKSVWLRPCRGRGHSASECQEELGKTWGTNGKWWALLSFYLAGDGESSNMCTYLCRLQPKLCAFYVDCKEKVKKRE